MKDIKENLALTRENVLAKFSVWHWHSHYPITRKSRFFYAQVIYSRIQFLLPSVRVYLCVLRRLDLFWWGESESGRNYNRQPRLPASRYKERKGDIGGRWEKSMTPTRVRMKRASPGWNSKCKNKIWLNKSLENCASQDVDIYWLSIKYSHTNFQN